MSKLIADFQIALRSLTQHGRRTMFLGAAIGAVTALLVLLTALASGARETMLHTATTLVTGHINIGGFFKVTAGQSAPVVTNYGTAMDVAKKALPEMEFAVQRGRGWAKAISETGSMQVGIGGIDIRDEPEFKQVLRIISGKIDDLEQPGTVMIFDNQAEKLDVKVGDALTVSAPTTRGANNTIDLRVVAIAKGIGLLSSWNVFIPSQSLRALYQLNPDATGAIHVHLKPQHAANLAPLAARLRSALEGAGFRVMQADARPFWMKFETVNREDWTGQKVDVTTWEDELSMMTKLLGALQWITGLLITVLLAIVVIGIMNTMWIAIRERTREIGTLRAIGMQRTGVMWLFLLESLLLGVIGTVVGALFGIAVSFGLNALHIPVPLSAQIILMSDHLHLVVHPADVIRGVVTITLITGLAALYPALRAARLRPVTAMQHFG
jgi:putative ABC transport system permease protein